MAANLAIAAGKIVIGSLANSLAVVADGLHSGVDALANAVALLILRYSTRPADEDHPYGHSKYETMAAFALSALLLLTAFELGRQAVGRIAHPETTTVSALTLGVMVVTVAVKVAVAWSERRAGLALHRREIPGLDPILDPLLALGVSLFIAYAAYAVFRDVLPILTDRIAFDPGQIAALVRQVPGVRSVHDIRSRGPAREAYVQMHLVVDPADVEGAHAIADEVERRLAESLGVKETFVHIEPHDDASGPPGTRG